MKLSGFVNFPLEDKAFNDTKEGGMFVRLVVIPKNHDWMKCSGGLNHIIYDETYQGDDIRLQVKPKLVNDPFKQMTNEQISKDKYEEFHFPHLNQEKYQNGEKLDPYEQVISRGYLNITTLGSVKWSGFNQETGTYWRCQFSDLTIEGKEIYHLLEKLYPNELILIQTWLDT